MVTLVAPSTAQVSWVVWPAVTLAGIASNRGAGSFFGLAESCGAASTRVVANRNNSVAVLMNVPRIILRPAMRPAHLATGEARSPKIVYSIGWLTIVGSRTGGYV